jgi:hypothetical protein
MISSLRSAFELTGKRAVLITADRATVYGWQGGELADALVFGADDAGLENFARFLRETPPTPVYVLVDIVEEEYRQDTIPHVFGSDRQSVLERKLTRMFRGTPYCYALMQGREGEGRRDDRVLLTALTKPMLVTPWLDRIAEHKVPLAGIYSLPLLCGELLRKIGATGQNVLLITLQSVSGLRQTFFRDQQFKISRLAPMPRLGAVPFGAYLMGELDKLRRYLNSIALTAPSAPLDVYILSHGEYLEELERHCEASAEERYFVVDVADVARKLGIDGAMTTPYGDALFAYLLLSGSRRNHYARPAQTRYFTLYQARVVLAAASLALLLGGTMWSGLNFIEGVSHKQQALDAQGRAGFYQARYERARRDLPPTPVEPRAIKTAVDIVSALSEHKSAPTDMMYVLSAALDGSPSVRIDRIEWLSSSNPNAAPDAGQRANESAAAAPKPVADGRYALYQIADVAGRIEPFSGDYRQAIDTINGFAELLRARSSIQKVSVLELPVDTSSNRRLSGDAGEQAAPRNARFVLRVVLGQSASVSPLAGRGAIHPLSPLAGRGHDEGFPASTEVAAR